MVAGLVEPARRGALLQVANGSFAKRPNQMDRGRTEGRTESKNVGQSKPESKRKEDFWKFSEGHLKFGRHFQTHSKMEQNLRNVFWNGPQMGPLE